jgi:hypothetical protein
MKVVIVATILFLLISSASFTIVVKADTSVTLLADQQTQFIVSDLFIDPPVINQGEETHIAFKVTNTGDSSGNYTAIMKVNNQLLDSADVSLDAGESTWVVTTVMWTAGTYVIDVDGLTGSLTINGPETTTTPSTSTSSTWTTTPPDEDGTLLIVIVAVVVVVVVVIIILLLMRAKKGAQPSAVSRQPLQSPPPPPPPPE